MDDIWKAIAEDYETATQAETKENLLYARVFMMMNDEKYNAWERDCFHKYIAPAKEAYEAAVREGGKQPTAKEMEKFNL